MSDGYSPGAGQPELPVPPHAVFISYSNEDKPVADSVCAALEASNIRCWIAPRDIQGGRPYSGQITQAIREANILLLILTRASNRSKHVLREVERAAHCQNHLLTFRIEPIAPCDDLAYFLGADQWVDGFTPLPPSQHFPVLIQHTRKLLMRASAEERPEEKAETAPEAFAHFQILRHPDGSLFKLGKGGMGVTYKAIDSTLNRFVALKVIAAEQLNSQHAKHRFLREARSAALIHHPHVATIYHFGEEAGCYFYAMEFVEGEDLERYIARNGPLSPATTLRVALQVAQALEAAQAKHLIHRDIKPANIMAVANRAGTLDVKLIDFGLAKGIGAESLDASRLTRTQDFVGSPAFASPEQCETKQLDIRSDIYSLGVTLWYLLAGKRPFVGTVGEVMVAQIIKPPPFEQLVQTPEPVVALLRRMLEKRPEDRFQTPEELQSAVEEAAAQLSAEFGAVPNRILPKPLPETPSPCGILEASPVPLATIAAPQFDRYLAAQVGMQLANRYRLVAEEREGNGGRLFNARDEQAPPGQPSEVAIKLLHPSIAGNPALLDLLENELGVMRQAAHPKLVRYYRLERGERCLVREWVHGFLLYDLLRWRQSLKAAELAKLLDPLAAALDFVAGHGLGLVDLNVRKILVECPGANLDFEALAKGDTDGWTQCTIKLNPLSLAPILFRGRNGWDRQTIVPASRVLSLTQAEAGIRGTKAVRLYGRLIYELLSGRAPSRLSDPQAYAPLPELDQRGNEILRQAFVSDDGAYRSCQEFWDALKINLASGARPAGPIPNLPLLPPPDPKRKRSPILVTAVVATAALIIGFAVFAAFRLSPSSTKSRALSEKIATPTPLLAAITPSTTPVIVPTPTPALPTPSPVATATPEPTGTPMGPSVSAHTVYEGTIRAKDDSSTNVPLIITIGSDLKSGTMTQSGHHGDLVVSFKGVWDGFTLRAVTDEVVSQPKGIQWEPESFGLHFGEDGKSVTYECVAEGKTYIADLSAQAPPPVNPAPIYKGTIRKRGETGSGIPLTVSFAADRRSGTMTYTSKSGDTVVRFNGTWDGKTLRAATNEVIAKPANIQWKPESFTLSFFEDGKRGSYECDSGGQLYETELFPP